MALLFIPFYPEQIFSAFTFTDPVDFFPLASLFLGIGGIWLAGRNKQTSLTVPQVVLLFMLSLWPLLPHVGIFLLAQEFFRVEGHWPEVMINDPKHVLGHISPLYDGYYDSVIYLEAFAGAWMMIYSLFIVVLRKRMSSKLFNTSLFVLFLTLVFVVVDPVNVYAWWVD